MCMCMRMSMSTFLCGCVLNVYKIAAEAVSAATKSSRLRIFIWYLVWGETTAITGNFAPLADDICCIDQVQHICPLAP